MNLPTTKPNYRDLAWYKAECASLLDSKNALNKIIDKLERENIDLRQALRNCALAASGQNWEQIAWIVEGALRKEAQP